MKKEYKSVSIKIPKKLLEKIDKAARSELRTRSNFILVCVQRTLEKVEE